MSLSDPKLRAADHPDTENAVIAAARGSVIAVLTDRLADRTLTESEFASRLERLHAAKTASELNSLMRDFVVQPPGSLATVGSSDAARFDGQHGAAAAHGGAPETGRLLAVLTEIKRIGRWVVPRRLEMRIIMGEVLIDLRDAVLPAGDIELALVGVLGRMRVLVPPGVLVDNTMYSVLSTARNDAEHAEGNPFAARLIRLTGDAMLTEVLVRVASAGEPAERAWKKAKPKRRAR